MKLTEQQLRRLIREELGSGTFRKLPIDLGPLQETIQDVAQRASQILRDSSGVEIDDEEWNRLNVASRLSNSLALHLKSELGKIVREWKGEASDLQGRPAPAPAPETQADRAAEVG
jgi:hypothetical protein